MFIKPRGKPMLSMGTYGDITDCDNLKQNWHINNFIPISTIKLHSIDSYKTTICILALSINIVWAGICCYFFHYGGGLHCWNQRLMDYDSRN